MPVGAAEPEKSFEQRLLRHRSWTNSISAIQRVRRRRCQPRISIPGLSQRSVLSQALWRLPARRSHAAPDVRSLVSQGPNGESHQAARRRRQLAKVAAEIDKLPEAVKQAAYPIAGTYSCRTVLDTGLTSVHAYAAAIDLNQSISDYWAWSKADGEPRYRNRMPLEIVDIFQRHGFILGRPLVSLRHVQFEYRPGFRPARGGSLRRLML